MNFLEAYEFFGERLWRELVQFPKKQILSTEDVNALMIKNRNYFQKYQNENITCRNVFLPYDPISVIVTNLFYVKGISPVCPNCKNNKVFILLDSIKNIDVHYLNKFFPDYKTYQFSNIVPSSPQFAQNRPLVIKLLGYGETKITNAKYYCMTCNKWKDIYYSSESGLIF